MAHQSIGRCVDLQPTRPVPSGGRPRLRTHSVDMSRELRGGPSKPMIDCTKSTWTVSWPELSIEGYNGSFEYIYIYGFTEPFSCGWGLREKLFSNWIIIFHLPLLNAIDPKLLTISIWLQPPCLLLTTKSFPINSLIKIRILHILDCLTEVKQIEAPVSRPGWKFLDLEWCL